MGIKHRLYPPPTSQEIKRITEVCEKHVFGIYEYSRIREDLRLQLDNHYFWDEIEIIRDFEGLNGITIETSLFYLEFGSFRKFENVDGVWNEVYIKLKG